MEKNTKSGFAVTALVLGMIGLVLSWVPIINNAAFVLGLIGVVFGIVALIRRNKKGMTIAGIILSVLAIVVTISTQKTYSNALNKASEETQNSLDNISGDNTDELLGTKVQVDLGEFTLETDQYGFITSDLPVTVKNLSDTSSSFSIELEAVDAAGNRLKGDYVYASSLASGQSQSFDAFSYVSSDEKDAMSAATFKIVSVSMY